MWLGTLRRCFYSIFQSVFALTAGKDPDELVTPTLQHADELQLACDAVPFLRASGGEWSPIVFAWDSSDTGFGVVFKPWQLARAGAWKHKHRVSTLGEIVTCTTSAFVAARPLTFRGVPHHHARRQHCQFGGGGQRPLFGP